MLDFANFCVRQKNRERYYIRGLEGNRQSVLNDPYIYMHIKNHKVILQHIANLVNAYI